MLSIIIVIIACSFIISVVDGFNPISSCIPIGAPGYYKLTQDIFSYDASIPCLSINSDGVTIDGDGHVIYTDVSAIAINLSFQSRITIANITLQGFDDGIHIYASFISPARDIIIRNTTITHFEKNAILATQVSDVTISDCTFATSQDDAGEVVGVSMTYSERVNVLGTSFYDIKSRRMNNEGSSIFSAVAIKFLACDNCTLSYNNFRGIVGGAAYNTGGAYASSFASGGAAHGIDFQAGSGVIAHNTGGDIMGGVAGGGLDSTTGRYRKTFNGPGSFLLLDSYSVDHLAIEANLFEGDLVHAYSHIDNPIIPSYNVVLNSTGCPIILKDSSSNSLTVVGALFSHINSIDNFELEASSSSPSSNFNNNNISLPCCYECHFVGLWLEHVNRFEAASIHIEGWKAGDSEGTLDSFTKDAIGVYLYKVGTALIESLCVAGLHGGNAHAANDAPSGATGGKVTAVRSISSHLTVESAYINITSGDGSLQYGDSNYVTYAGLCYFFDFDGGSLSISSLSPDLLFCNEGHTVRPRTDNLDHFSLSGAGTTLYTLKNASLLEYDNATGLAYVHIYGFLIAGSSVSFVDGGGCSSLPANTRLVGQNKRAEMMTSWSVGREISTLNFCVGVGSSNYFYAQLVSINLPYYSNPTSSTSTSSSSSGGASSLSSSLDSSSTSSSLSLSSLSLSSASSTSSSSSSISLSSSISTITSTTSTTGGGSALVDTSPVPFTQPLSTNTTSLQVSSDTGIALASISFNTTILSSLASNAASARVEIVPTSVLLACGRNTWQGVWRANVFSAVFNLTIVIVGGEAGVVIVSDDHPVALSFATSASSLAGLCLGYIEESTNRWLCEDLNLVFESDGIVRGYTTHLTSFAIIVNPAAKTPDQTVATDPAAGINIYAVSFGVVGGVLGGVALVFVAVFVAKRRDKNEYNLKEAELE
eukprot:TRINITY_DN3912_c0_g2_i1.p1 TRINITY_DN3912_c0_g2~~TRINITY_DN3912_c0_g2_i1.p1  ORF type:complete len:955 (-),score=161.43 TRINITY_DN3912_c0_g2_i1:4-2805(-)